jgi:tRNA-uridine 2-sulfurtransferase
MEPHPFVMCACLGTSRLPSGARIGGNQTRRLAPGALLEESLLIPSRTESLQSPVSSSNPKVLLAMSGGVDSSVAAALLLREGYDVVGVFMRLGTPGESLDEPMPVAQACAVGSSDGTPSLEDAGSTGTHSSGHAPGNALAGKTLPLKIQHQGCCSISDAADARLVAAELGIPLYVCNFKKDFGRIIDYFTTEYASGRTPNPCVRCNDWLKFGKLHDYAKQLGAQFVASGHYAQLDRSDPGACRLLAAVDETKDQSYVLFGAPRDRLNEMLLPVGSYHKHEIRDLAQQFNLPVFDKPDSQEICFVPDNDYASLVERMNDDAARAHASGGDILDLAGNVVGRHGGQHRYTIGQRRGVGVATGSPIYVIDKDPVANTITVGPREHLLVTSCIAGETNWLVDMSRFADWSPCFAKYRYNTPAVAATARVVRASAREAPVGDEFVLEVRFDSPQAAVAPGQAVVLYSSHDIDNRVGQGEEGDGRTGSGGQVLGGGWICEAAQG